VLVAFVVYPGLGPHPTRVRHNYVMYFRFGYLSGIGVARIFDRGGGPVNDPLDSSLDSSMLDSSLFSPLISFTLDDILVTVMVANNGH